MGVVSGGGGGSQPSLLGPFTVTHASAGIDTVGTPIYLAPQGAILTSAIFLVTESWNGSGSFQIVDDANTVGVWSFNNENVQPSGPFLQGLESLGVVRLESQNQLRALYLGSGATTGSLRVYLRRIV